MSDKYEKSSSVKSNYKPTNLNREIIIKQMINGVPHISIAKKPGEVGRPRLVPKTFLSHKELKELLGIKIKDMTPEQKRTYNRLAQRLDYAKTKQMEENKETSTQYKTKDQLKNYNKLAKQEERLIKKYSQ